MPGTIRRMPRLRSLSLAAVTAVLALPATAPAADTYCSPSGDVCTSVAKQRGVRYLQLQTFSFQGPVRITVRHLDSDTRDTRSFRLRQTGSGIYAVKARWTKAFPNHGPGRYRVTFRAAGTQIGPVLGFRFG
jgi:hypothetical protein